MNEDDAVAYLKIVTPTGNELEILQNLINAVTRRIESYCNRIFISRSVDEMYDGPGLARMPLRYFPILSVATLERLSEVDATVLTSYTASQFRIDSQHGFLYLTTGELFSYGFANWRVVYSPGWASLSTVPDEIILAAKMLVARAWRDYAERKDDVESLSFEGQLTIFNKDGIPQKIRSLLDPWRSPILGRL
jgi:hypothetical protein